MGERGDRYTPSDIEFHAVEERLTSDERAASEVREQFFRQPKESVNLREPELTVSGERLPPTPEQVEEMDARLSALERIVGGSSMNWQLDGGLAISAYNGEYIGYHKDIDLSISPGDVPELQQRALAAGYGLFIGELYRDQQNEVQYAIRPADVALYLKDRHHRFLIRVDDQGKIQQGGELDFIDVHIPPATDDGREIGPLDLPLPKEWNETRSVTLHGHDIHVPPLGKVAYYKLYSGRPIDIGDLRAIALADDFTDTDMAELEGQVQTEYDNKISGIQQLLNKAAESFSEGMTEDDIRDMFHEKPGRWSDGMLWEQQREFAVEFFAAASSNLEEAKHQLFEEMSQAISREHLERVAEMKRIRAERNGT
jgi:hypothetical protein